MRGALVNPVTAYFIMSSAPARSRLLAVNFSETDFVVSNIVCWLAQKTDSNCLLKSQTDTLMLYCVAALLYIFIINVT